jgi:hypothetical protein
VKFTSRTFQSENNKGVDFVCGGTWSGKVRLSDLIPITNHEPITFSRFK